MAGHSKWANIKHTKRAEDAKRSKIFAKLSREVMIAARDGGGDPEANPRLRMVLLKCRQANMPADNIDRAIKRGIGEDGADNFEELIYEVFGEHGVAILVELTTDNRNRTASEIRRLVGKNGGSMASIGSVTHLFQRRGHIVIPKTAAGEDRVMEILLELGAEDFQSNEETYEVLTDPQSFEAVYKGLESGGIQCDVAHVTWLPYVKMPLNEADAISRTTQLLEALEEHDDVKEVYTNAVFPE